MSHKFLHFIMWTGLLITVAGFVLVLFFDLEASMGMQAMVLEAVLITVGSLMFLPTKIYLIFHAMEKQRG